MKMSKAVVVQWFQQQPREVITDGIHQLAHQWDDYFSMHGTIVNSMYFNKPHTFSDGPCGLVVRVLGYRSRGPGLDPRRYQIF
jgi:hypothetical protein